MTVTAMKMNELAETQRHNREQELIGKANVVSNLAGSLASIYTKRLPRAIDEARTSARSEFAEIGSKANKSFRRGGSRK